MIVIRETQDVDDRKLLELSRLNPGYQFERGAGGELIVAPTGGESARREARLLLRLGQWSSNDRRGPIFSSSGGFRLPDGSIRSPDAAWVCAERWSSLSADEREGFVPFAPDVAIEIRSKTDSIVELREKMRAYIANGTRLAVLIDPYERFTELHRPGQDVRTSTGARVSLAPEMPDFELDAEAIF